jgi:aspartate kinase
MQVYKFGGASVKDAHSVKNVATTLQANPANDKVVVISAMGKSTNELENVVNLYTAGNDSCQGVLDTLYDRSAGTGCEYGEMAGAKLE